MMTVENLVTLARLAIERTRLRPRDPEVVEGATILRFTSSNGVVIGSVTIEHALAGQMDEAQATELINARVLEAARAGMKEPGIRV